MNKKIIIFGILLIVLIIAISYIIINKKNLEVKIVDQYGEKINNFENNNMPFTIIKEDKNQKITVNGEEYLQDKRIYETGEYNIVIENGNKTKTETIKINNVDKKPENEYNIYVITETLQTLFASLEMAENKDQNGFFWTQRTSTIDTENIKNNFKNITISQHMGELDSDDFKTILIPEIEEYIKEVLKKNPNAYFHLYTEEDNFYLELELFGKIGLNDNRYQVTLYTTGTLSYVKEYEITKKNKYDRFIEEKQKYEEIVFNIKSNLGNYSDYPGSYLVDEDSQVFNSSINYDYMFISLFRNNIEYLIQYPELITFEDDNIKNEMKNANIKKIVAQDNYEKLQDDEKEVFFSNISLNKKDLDDNYFNDTNKDYLIITGTVPFDGPYEKDEYKEIIKKVYNDYKDKYNILYKPHPRAIPNDEEKSFLESLGIKILPGEIPMEAIMFIYPNLKIGGFGSSLYMSVDEGKTEFFFADNYEDLVEPLNKLYNKLFSNAKFYN